MFIETRQSRKGKKVDDETQTAIDKLQDSVKNSTESETSTSLFGKEKFGRVRCYGRTNTPTMFKRNQEISVIKKQHSDEVAGMKREMDGMKVLFKTTMKQENPHMSDEKISNMMASALGTTTKLILLRIGLKCCRIGLKCIIELNGDEEACDDDQDMEEEQEEGCDDQDEDEYYDA
ncbi:uncharacterized protein LOC131605784 [Vicia villosa]|uniref:uncharacterized protein LOC131605784 n=1 Tax=Vicia villosa TaxID=3911 RepID=UPI00273BD00D|nr:uncharacterized protein LOC131605784 [Vicia villosa]